MTLKERMERRKREGKDIIASLTDAEFYTARIASLASAKTTSPSSIRSSPAMCLLLQELVVHVAGDRGHEDRPRLRP